MNYQYQKESLEIFDKIRSKCQGTVSEQELNRGVFFGEPIVIMMDCAIRYAKAYRKRFDQNIECETVLKEYFGALVFSLKEMCNWDGAMCMEGGGESKDNECVCIMFDKACEIAGINSEELC